MRCEKDFDRHALDGRQAKVIAKVAYVGLFFGITLALILANPPNVHGGKSEIGPDALIRIVRSEPLRIIRRCDEIPREDLINAGIISRAKRMKSFIVDRNEPYQSGDGLVDPQKAQRQLIFGAVSEKYLLLCFWMGGQGGPGRYLMVIHRGRAKSEVVCYGSLGTVGKLRNLADLSRLIESDRFSLGEW
jgi:hypothetical protein